MLNPNVGGSRNKYAKGWYESPIAGKVYLESSWEYKVALELDENDINWKRPKKPFIWVDENKKSRRYYPDFYLIDYNVYLDPKNPYLALQDKYKIDDVINRHNINLFIISNEDDLKWNKIIRLLADVS